jgi:hypothetical protein
MDMNTLEKDNVKGDDQKIETRNEDKVLPQLTIHTLKEISSKTFVATQFLIHVLINFQKNPKIAKNIENPKNTFLIHLHRF